MEARDKLLNDFKRALVLLSVDAKKRNAMAQYLEEKYKVPSSVTLDYVLGQKAIQAADNQVLFFLCDGVDTVNKRNVWKKHFTDIEQRTWSASMYESDEKIKWPLRFKMVRVANDSWIGPITAKELVTLYNAQLINYNTNTQRALKQYYVKNDAVYRIAINKTAVSEIKALLQEGKYIPNTITLNIPMDEEDENEFSYNANSCELVVKKLKMFDILDGYHRLLAISQVVNEDGTDYPMELRITNYDVLKARQFIYQEDQKTKMKKADSDVYNVYSPENRVISKLNMDPACEVQGLIGQGDARISSATLSEIINKLWFHGKRKDEQREAVNAATKCLMQAFNALVAANPVYGYKDYTYKEILAVCYYANKLMSGDTEENLGEQILSLIHKADESDDVRLSTSRKFTTVSVMGCLDKLATEV